MKTVTDFPHHVSDIPDMAIMVGNDCRLSARVWMPDDAVENPVPAILEFLPYRKRDGTTARDALTHAYFAGHGYACLRVDMRGNGDSEGLMDDEYSPQELKDAVEVIDWIARQPWCTGSVGMMGISWGGFNALQTAALQPEPLKAIITLCSTVDRFADDIHYKGGCLLNENLGWGATMWAYSSRAPDPAIVGEKWRDMWLDRLAAEPFLPSVWLRHQHRDEYWQHGSVGEDYSAIKAATLAIGGWGDSYKNAVPALVKNLSAPVKGIIGPWVHKYPHFAVPEPRIGFLQEALRWWDHWLKGLDTGVENDPAYRAYIMDGVRPKTWYTERPGRWVAQKSAPDEGVKISEFQCVDGGLATSGVLSRGAIIASPQHCGMAGGEYCAIWLGPEMPGDQRGDDALSVCFDSDPFAQDQDIFGAPTVRLNLTPDTAQAQIAVRLCHVHPDGASTRITYGVLNLSHRNGSANPEPLQPGQACEIQLQLDHIAYRLPKGHRLRLAVSNAYWPLIWPMGETGSLILNAGSLALPIRPLAGGDEWQFEPAETAPAQEIISHRPANHSRRIETDLTTGEISLLIEDDFGSAENADHGLIAGSVAREHWRIHPDDPLCASGTTHWTETSARGDWSIRTETYATMRSDKTHFYLTARLEAYEGDDLVYSRDVEDKIPRA